MPYADKAKQRAYQRDRSATLRRWWLQANGPCVDCGSWIDLEVDHNDRATKVSHRIWSWRPARRLAELAKCSPRCKPCHKAKTRRETTANRRHGTAAMWRRAGCRCEVCRTYAREAQRIYRADRRKRESQCEPATP